MADHYTTDIRGNQRFERAREREREREAWTEFLDVPTGRFLVLRRGET